jgi:endonuclease/exonuclease/phosphatase family metal-dependent hydrolase
MNSAQQIRVVTYNIHKCRGLDLRVRPQRIVEVLREVNADIVALQEVLSVEGRKREDNQARFVAHELGLEYRAGETRRLRGGSYGNVILTRMPVLASQHYDVSIAGRERRGCLRADIEVDEQTVLHVYNVHLGTAFIERPHQVRKLLNAEILERGDVTGPRVLLGDFNEWTRGVTSRLLAKHFDSADIRHHLQRSRTYPGVLPFLHLDHIYFDAQLELIGASLHNSRTARIASDHLPIVAEFSIQA